MNFDSPPADPVVELESWMARARELTDLPNPNAAALATVDADGSPSVRIVLIKHLDERGVVFFTNRGSRKGRALAANPRAAMAVHWDPLNLQIRIEGSVSEAEDSLSDDYFASRPRGSQIGAWASDQSQPIGDRAMLDDQVSQIERRFEGQSVPRPPFWGGYRLSLDRLEFWAGREGRLHDRLIYHHGEQGWTHQRLCP